MSHRYPFLSLWNTPLPPSLPPPDPREIAPPFLPNHTSAYPVAMTIEEAEGLRALFDEELDALAVTGGNCRVAQVRQSRGGSN